MDDVGGETGERDGGVSRRQPVEIIRLGVLAGPTGHEPAVEGWALAYSAALTVLAQLEAEGWAVVDVREEDGG